MARVNQEPNTPNPEWRKYCDTPFESHLKLRGKLALTETKEEQVHREGSGSGLGHTQGRGVRREGQVPRMIGGQPVFIRRAKVMIPDGLERVSLW